MILVGQQMDGSLSRLARDGDADILSQSLVGLEKESLRVAKEGGIAMTPHPRPLGSPLTHPWITTDYSEALLELITPPFARVGDALQFLSDLHLFVDSSLDNELLWATSMPCVLAGEQNIPIAEYGTSNAGRMKHLYRIGLGYRYGRVMQVIAGVHFNYSLAPDFWPMYQEVLGEKGEARVFRDSQYMGLIRNLQRFGWLIPYLFGASPAVCKSFFAGRESPLSEFDEATYYEPYATSLRMGDIGYQNHREEGLGIKANYDSLDTYVASLAHAIKTPAPLWEAIGVKVNGEYRQLNANILQIENEYYSTVRPKQLLDGLEKPTLALKRRGIAYVELRSLDVNAYNPLGIGEEQVRFLELFMLFCLLVDSPQIGANERREIDHNLESVAHRGRDPSLRLQRSGRAVPLAIWAAELLDAMYGICDLLVKAEPQVDYHCILDGQFEKVSFPELTPSGRMLDEMRDRGESFYQFARRLSQMHHKYFTERELDETRRRQLVSEASESFARQAAIEAADSLGFDEFLARYDAQ